MWQAIVIDYICDVIAPCLVYMPRIYPRVISGICVFYVTGMHVRSLARCV